LIIFILALAIPNAGHAVDATSAAAGHGHLAQAGKPRTPATQPGAPKLSKQSPAAEYTPNVRYRLAVGNAFATG
jgi:hypothetical protein